VLMVRTPVRISLAVGAPSERRTIMNDACIDSNEHGGSLWVFVRRTPDRTHGCEPALDGLRGHTP
jgi:hypothetical protein